MYPGSFRTVRIRLSEQNVHDTIKAVLSSCNLPLDYVENVSARDAKIKSAGTGSGASRQQPGDSFAETVDASILDRFYGVHAYDQSQIRMRRMARDTLRCKF